MANLNYYLGPWQWQNGDDPGWNPPAGTVASVDLRSIPDQSITTLGDRPHGFFAVDGSLGGDYVLLGSGDCREIATTGAMQSAWQSLIGRRPRGDWLVDLLFSQLTDLSTPDGSEPTMPLVPTVAGNLEIHLAGHSRVVCEPFKWGSHRHKNKLRDLLRRQFQKAHDDVQAGRLPPKHHRRVLDYWCDKYKARGQWRDFVPPGLLPHVPGPLKHQTTVSDDFNRSNESLEVGNWDSVRQSMVVASNHVETDTSQDNISFRWSDALSSDDHYSQVEFLAEGDGVGPEDSFLGPVTRFGASIETYYRHVIRRNASGGEILQKFVSGTVTTLLTQNNPHTAPYTTRGSSDGSTIRTLVDASQVITLTDTTIVGNLHIGIMSRGGSFAGVGQAADNFEAADLAVSGGNPWNYYAQQQAVVG